MKNYWLLTRVMIKTMLASMDPRNSLYTDGRKKQHAVFRSALVALTALFGLGSVIYLEYLIFQGLTLLKLPVMLPSLAILLSMLLTIWMGLFQCLSELFQGKDAPFLAMLPLTSQQTFCARLTTLYLFEIAADALICLPAFIMYAVGQGNAWPITLTGLPILLFLPLIPLSGMVLVASLLMRLTFISRHREGLTMALSIIFVIAYSVGITLMNSGDMETADIVAMLTRSNGLIDYMLRIFPPALWAVKGLTGEWLMLLLFAAVSLLCAATVILLCGPGYLEQALSSTENTVHRAKRHSGSVWHHTTSFRALHRLEWREILRTPSWAYNCLVCALLIPVMFFIGFFSEFSRSAEGMGALADHFAQIDPGFKALFSGVVIMFGSLSSPAVSTAISREGGKWPFALTLPVPQQTRFHAKLLVGLEINLVSMTAISGVIWFLTRIPFIWLSAAFLFALLVSQAAAMFSLWVDASRPFLSWATENDALRKNFNQVLSMLLWFALVGLCFLPVILLWHDGGTVALAGAMGVAALETISGGLLVHRAAQRNRYLPESY